jgi:hypothetical protein
VFPNQADYCDGGIAHRFSDHYRIRFASIRQRGEQTWDGIALVYDVASRPEKRDPITIIVSEVKNPGCHCAVQPLALFD